MKKMMMYKMLMVLAVAITSLALAGAPAFADHKPNHNPGGGGGGGGDDPPPTAVVDDPSTCTNSGSIPLVGAFNFGYEDAAATVSLSGKTCVGWYNQKGNHDATFGHMDMGMLVGHCDFSGNNICYLDMSQVANDMGLVAGDIYLVEYHCHQHENHNMLGWIDLTVLN